jgi:hypothetical protein
MGKKKYAPHNRCCKDWLKLQISKYLYNPISLEEREIFEKHKDSTNPLLFQTPQLKQKQFSYLRIQMREYDQYVSGNPTDWRYYRENEFNDIARRLWNSIQESAEWQNLTHITKDSDLPRQKCLRISRIWTSMRIIQLLDKTGEDGCETLQFLVKKRLRVLPSVLYIQSPEKWNTTKKLFIKHRFINSRKKYKRKRRFD